MDVLSSLITVGDYEAQARETTPPFLYDNVFGNLDDPDHITNTNNVKAFQRLALRPRVMVDVTHRNLSTEVLGHKIKFPVMLAPAGSHQRVHPDGELASVRAAGAVGTLLALSTASNYSLEEVAAAATGPIWFQLYMFRDREISRILVERAMAAGYTGIILTVDNLGAPSWLMREMQVKYSTTADPFRFLKNFEGIDRPNLPTMDAINESFDGSFSWSDLEWVRSITSLPLVIKGIQTGEDAKLCLEHGADALIVSNHGGHTLQGTIASIEMLPEVMDAVGDGLEVYLDSGIRRGGDVLKSLALGAKGVFIGRANFWGLSVAGEEGVRRVLEILRDELDREMALCGVTDVNKLDKSLVAWPNGVGNGNDSVGRLERLARLLEQGHLTPEEFEAQKRRILR